MGKIIFYGAISLDGYLATTDDNLDWLTGLPDIPADTGQAVLGKMTSAIMGRVTYDFVSQMGPETPLNPANPEMHSYVLTHHPYPERPLTTFTARDVRSLATDLKAGPGNVWLVGGSAILTPLLATDLVDEIYLQIAPTLLGRGKRLFGELTNAKQFTLVTAHAIGPLAELIYRRRN